MKRIGESRGGDPLDEFVKRLAKAESQVDYLKELIDDHLGYHPDDIRWDHVGSAEHLVDELEDIISFIKGR